MWLLVTQTVSCPLQHQEPRINDCEVGITGVWTLDKCIHLLIHRYLCSWNKVLNLYDATVVILSVTVSGEIQCKQNMKSKKLESVMIISLHYSHQVSVWKQKWLLVLISHDFITQRYKLPMWILLWQRQIQYNIIQQSTVLAIVRMEILNRFMMVLPSFLAWGQLCTLLSIS